MFKSKMESTKNNKDSKTTIIGQNTQIDGNFVSDSDAEICGKIDGDIEVNGSLVIGESARIKANIKCETIYIHGAVEGNLVADSDVTIAASGNVVGDITLGGNFVIEPGAVFIGSSKMQEKDTSTNLKEDSISDDDLDIDLD